jgi:uncharacterized protein (DUF302 family)
MEISTALPCRISVYTEGDKVRLATLKPTVLVSQFNIPDFQPVAKEVEEILIQKMEEDSV